MKIGKIYPNSAAQKASLMIDDDILTVNDIATDIESFDKILAEGGQNFELKVYRAGKTLKLKVELTKQTYFDIYNVVYL